MTDCSTTQSQILFEEECVSGGLVRFRERNQRLRRKGQEGITPAGQRLLRGVIDPVSQGVKDFLETSKGRSGPRHAAVKYLELFEPDVAAFLTMRVLIDGMTSHRRSLLSVALSIGGRLQDEIRFRTFDEDQPNLFKRVISNLDKHPDGSNPVVRRSMLTHTIKKNNLTLIEWSKTDRLHLGVAMVNMAVECTGLFVIARIRNGRREKQVVQPTDKLMEWVKNCDARMELMSPWRLPMLCPPNDWTSPHDGGYLTNPLRTKLVMGRSRGFLKELELRPLDTVYAAVNALQQTAWKINSPMLTLLEEITQSGLELEGWPSHHEIPRVPKPENYLSLTVDARRSWKMKAADAYRKEEQRRSNIIQTTAITRIAKQLADKPSIYFPHYLDFRGRMYPLPQYLNPQGTDLAKSLLTFAEGKPLGKEGVRWLSIHIANCFGQDKCSLSDRAAWTTANSSKIEATANDPTGDLWWTEADKPFQFLAAAIEWLGYLRDGGEQYVCSLPIMVDGSNNGLQHLSALLRDESCGRLVNLVPQATPADIYSSVAEEVKAALRLDLIASENVTEVKDSYAAQWLTVGIDRDLMKRPVMVLPYGGTYNAIKNYLAEKAGDRPHGFGLEFSKAITYLANVTWEVLAQRIVGPRIAMDWIRSASTAFTKSNRKTAIPICWSVPSGFLVQQKYLSMKTRRVKTKVGDSIVKLNLAEESDQLDPKKSSQALSPNFIHSLDAAALSLTIGSCRSLGVTSFAAVHDSYGTHASDMPILHTELRHVFVQMYTPDLLAGFAEEITKGLEPGKELDPLPPRGSLDLTGVLKSDFFFA